MKLQNNIINMGLALLIGASVSSCSDFLEIEPLNDIVLEKFWNEESDVENIVAGCYSALQTQVVVDRMMAWGEFRSDNVVGGTNIQNDASLQNIFKENLNASNAYTSWGEFYDVINRCNTVIYYAPTVAEKDPNFTQSELSATVAEVSALRDLCYFYLIRAFRDVPYTTVPYLDDTQKMDQPAVKFDLVLDSLIMDLEKVQDDALKKYPETKTYYQKGRITQDAIHAMLCEMYLWKQDYTNSVKYANMVIESLTKDYEDRLSRRGGSISSTEQLIDGYPLISDKPTSGNTYGDAFNSIFETGNSRESILELIYMNDDNMLSNAAVSVRYGNSRTFPGFVKPADFIGSDVKDELFAVYLTKYDTRSYENVQAIGSSDYGINKYVSSAYLDVSSSDYKTSYGSRAAEGYCHSNWILYRLTDVMLMKAEALVQMVNSDDTTAIGKQNNDSLLVQAYNIVNTINKRSNCATSNQDIKYDSYSSKNQMANLVMDERQRELMFEGKRWFDLVRRSLRDGNTNYLISAVMRKGSDNASVTQSKLARMDAIFWPYNKDELKVNSSLTQNPAFGSGENNSYSKN
ncbi:MAG: RagB/SusD family nutrient uptake outer membrane protein [Prevotella sp.]|nr:RagB/SusD family nutrient uptake outer membrane protein [Prevotella sp.]MBQ6208211.1 RagB/SusD family nutrient uptake outer membrane protein [Prevotella sp.]